jgi:hypothetical protein
MSSTTTAMILSLCGDPTDYDSTRCLAIQRSLGTGRSKRLLNLPLPGVIRDEVVTS